MPDPEDLSRHLPLAFAKHQSQISPNLEDGFRITPEFLGQIDGRDGMRSHLRIGEQTQPECGGRGLECGGDPAMPLEDGLQAFLAHHGERLTQPEHNAQRRGCKRHSLRLHGPGAFPIEVEPWSGRPLLALPCGRTDAEHRQAGRQHPSFLRRGHRDIDAQRSTGRSIDPIELTPSTTSSRLWRLTTPARASSGLVTPVEVSLWVISTVAISALRLSRSSRSFGSAASPQGSVYRATSAPKAAARSANRSPKAPMVTARTRSPGEITLATALSRPPVPLAGNISMSCLVWNA